METPLYIALSQQATLRRQMEIVAHNVANMNTTGFKTQKTLFQTYLVDTKQGDPLAMVQDYAVMRDLRPGALQETGNRLDFALQGDGYFKLETVNGPRYTRAGNFQLNDEGTLVDANGLPVLSDQDAAITIPPGAAQLTVTADGIVRTEQGEIGRIGVFRFEREQFMSEIGGGLLSSDEEPELAEETSVLQGMLEGSNVQPIVEMTNLIEVSRMYTSTQKLLEAEHERQRGAIGRLTKMS